jgi:hypothetical protein
MKVSPAGIPIWFRDSAPFRECLLKERKIIAMADGGFVVTVIPGSTPF